MGRPVIAAPRSPVGPGTASACAAGAWRGRGHTAPGPQYEPRVAPATAELRAASPARAYDHAAGHYSGPRARLSARPAPRGNDHPQEAEQDVAVIRQETTAIREAAEKETAHLRAVILSLSEQLGQMSAYMRENLASPGGLATMPAPAIAPPRPRSRPGAPSARPPRPAGPRTTSVRRRTAPTRKPQARARQYNAMRVAAAATATLFSFAALTGTAELAGHGFKFFVFRQTGTGETGQPDTETDQQFLAQQAAAAKGVVSKPAAAKSAASRAATQNAHRPGRHSAKSTSGQ
jgi:hypothetical protein